MKRIRNHCVSFSGGHYATLIRAVSRNEVLGGGDRGAKILGSKCFVAVAGTEKKKQQRNGQTVNLAQRAVVLGCMVDASIALTKG